MEPHAALVSAENHVPPSPRKHAALSSLDNRSDVLEHRRIAHNAKTHSDRVLQSSVQIPPMKIDGRESPMHVLKHLAENTPVVQENKPTLSIIQQSFKTTHNDRVQPIRQRPSVGGKSVATAKQARGRKRMSPEQLQQLSRRIDPTEPVALHRSPTKPALPELDHSRKRSRLRVGMEPNGRVCHAGRPSLYRTCVDIWPGASSLGELSHKNIQSLSELLKVRLSQAKFRVLATLESNDATTHNNDLYASLQTNEPVSVSPPPLVLPVKLLPRRHKPAPFMTPIGNGKNLFTKPHTFRRGVSMITDSSGKLSVSMKPRKQNASFNKPRKERDTQRQRSRAADVTPVTLDDGSRVFVCEPCNKKYKNRNGLAYHLDRCKYQPSVPRPPAAPIAPKVSKAPKATKVPTTPEEPEEPEESEEPEEPEELEEPEEPDTSEEQEASEDPEDIEYEDDENSAVQCICSNPTDDKGLMVQCDQCNVWLHLECLGLAEDSLDDVFHCPRCTDDMTRSSARKFSSQTDDFRLLPRKGKNLLRDLEAAQNSSENEEQEKRPLHPSLFDIFSETIMPLPTSSYDQGTTTSLAPPLMTGHESHPNLWHGFDFGSQLSDDGPDSSLSNGPSWTDLSMMQPPSLLFSDNTLGSAMDDEFAAPLPSEVVPPSDLSANTEPLQGVDALWFDFTNFEDDFQFDTLSPRSP